MTDADIKAEEQRAKVLEQKASVSSRISDLSRYIGFGLVAVVYTILTAKPGALSESYSQYSDLLLLAGLLGVITILFDYLQFLSGYFSVSQALKNQKGAYRYPDNTVAYKFRNVAFWLKQITTFAGTVLLLIAMFLSLQPACS
jgi:hypothetical protein